MNQINSLDAKALQMKFVAGELQGLRKVISYLYDGNNEAFGALYFIKENYKEWPAMISWLYRQGFKGRTLVEFFQNESPDGGGYHMGAMKIVSMIEGMKHQSRNIKIDELI